jgi:hypothetical protein
MVPRVILCAWESKVTVRYRERKCEMREYLTGHERVETIQKSSRVQDDRQ